MDKTPKDGLIEAVYAAAALCFWAGITAYAFLVGRGQAQRRWIAEAEARRREQDMRLN